MNRPTQVSDPESEEQASLWAVRLEGSVLTTGDRAELDSWLAGDPARRELLSRFCRLSARLDRLVPELAAAGSVQVPAASARPAGGWSPWKVAAAGLVAAAIAVAAVWMGGSGARSETISTPAGKRGTFTLSDGTRVELNANTSMLVENSRAERRVRLANGEAFFVVSKDKARPFIVETPAGSVRVTGTIFSVLTEAASQLEVTVVEGSVQVRTGEANGGRAPSPFVLGAGDRFRDEDGAVSLRALSDTETQDALAWRRGQIVCVGMPLADALARYAHYHGRLITVTSGAGRVPVGGIYGLGDLDEFLAYVRQGLNLRVAQGADGSVHVSLPTEP
jgi:transmembrane sensor